MTGNSIMMVELVHDCAMVPTRATGGAAGFDLYSCEDTVVEPHSRSLVETGIAIALPPNTVGLVWPRSGLAVKKGIDVGAGVIDEDYRGGVAVLLFNHTDDRFYVSVHDRIAQLVIQPVTYPKAMVTNGHLEKTERNMMGFGSTGK